MIRMLHRLCVLHRLCIQRSIHKNMGISMLKELLFQEGWPQNYQESIRQNVKASKSTSLVRNNFLSHIYEVRHLTVLKITFIFLLFKPHSLIPCVSAHMHCMLQGNEHTIILLQVLDHDFSPFLHFCFIGISVTEDKSCP